MKTRVLINEGFASSISDFFVRSGKKTIGYYAGKEIKNILEDTEIQEIHSTRIMSREKMKNFILRESSEPGNLLVIGKSMGAVETYDFFQNHWKEVRSSYHKIAWICVDGHSKLLKDTFRYCYGRKKSFRRSKSWKSEKIRIFNVFQQRVYPHGAKFIDADYSFQFTDKNITHFSIIERPETLNMIAAACNWLRFG